MLCTENHIAGFCFKAFYNIAFKLLIKTRLWTCFTGKTFGGLHCLKMTYIITLICKCSTTFVCKWFLYFCCIPGHHCDEKCWVPDKVCWVPNHQQKNLLQLGSVHTRHRVDTMLNFLPHFWQGRLSLLPLSDTSQESFCYGFIFFTGSSILQGNGTRHDMTCSHM